MSDQNQNQSPETVTTPSEQEQEQIVGGSSTGRRPGLEADPSHFTARALNTKFDPGGPPAAARK